MITNFVIDDSVLRHRGRRLGGLFVVAAARRERPLRAAAGSFAAGTIDPFTGDLSASWTAASSDAGATQNSNQDIDPGRKRSWI